jgi:hypothetical protein
MAVIVVCAVLVAAGIAFIIRWGASPPEGAPGAPLPRYLVGLAMAGPVAGLLAAGAGGRLVMRLLAVTSSDARGGITEAGETIGEITVGGTAGFVLFAGVPAGALAALLFVLTGALLPRGRLGGAVLGLVLLVLVGAQIEPLRADNFDFNLVGPRWLSLLAFSALAVFQGMLTRALAGRFGLQPLPVRGRAVRIAAAVLVLVALPGFVGAVADIAVS